MGGWRGGILIQGREGRPSELVSRQPSKRGRRNKQSDVGTDIRSLTDISRGLTKGQAPFQDQGIYQGGKQSPCSHKVWRLAREARQ